MTHPPTIPLVDFAKWTPNASSADRLAVSEKLVSACRTSGYAYIQNHGRSSDLLAEAIALNKKLFNLPPEALAQVQVDEKHKDGYWAPGKEKASRMYGKEKIAPEDVMTLNVGTSLSLSSLLYTNQLISRL